MEASLAREILDFWFDDAAASPAQARARSRVWFGRDPAFDAELGRRFGDFPLRARAGLFDDWRLEPEGALARIVVLDQFPRNLHRGSAEAFAFDTHAQAAASDALARGHDAALEPLQAAFVYLPFEHAEDLALQRRSVECYEALQARAPQELADLFASFTDYARRHLAVIARFGRFPHRNAAVGRASTPEETAYLESGGERFG